MSKTLSPEDQRAYDIVRQLFKNDNGDPFCMTAGQITLFRAIYERQHPRTQFECYTQYGKSDTVSMAVLLRATTFPEKWVILGGTKDKAGIIMGKLINHIFDNEYTLGKFQVGADESLETIRRLRNRDHVTFNVDKGKDRLGEVMILSADTRRRSEDAGDILIGHGSQNLIEDDAALIPDGIHGKAMRMLGGFQDNFLLKITNSFGRNHAFRSSNNPRYRKHVIAWQQGVEEGRVTEDYIQEMREELDPIMFGILYDCVYPPSDVVDEQGWMQAISIEDVDAAQKRAVEPTGRKKMGCDVGEGVNYNAFVIRQDNYARIYEKNLERSLMKTAEHVRDVGTLESIRPQDVFIDAIGVGAGVVSRLHELECSVNGVKVGTKATEKTEAELKIDPVEFSNLKAEILWKMLAWIRQGGALEPNKDWNQLCKLRYRENGSKRIEFMSKEQMRMRGLLSMSESTDIPDALALTFAPGVRRVVTNQASPPPKAYYPNLN